ncbi:MAG: hypothetical protein AABO58_11155 [Acidobacteriota bacterium]
MTAFPSEGSARPLARLLFEEPALPNDESLFRSATDLAEFIVANHPEYAGRKPKNVATFIHQIARGERTAPDKLHDAIAMAIRARVPEPEAQEAWLDRLTALLSGAAHAEPRVTDADELWTRILEHARTAREHFIITAQPAEARQPDAPAHDDEDVVGQAKQLAMILQERLNLLTPVAEFEVPSNVQYTFCFPDRTTGTTFWTKLLDSMWYTTTPACTKEEAKQRLTLLNERAVLRVLKVPEIACGCPLVAYDPTSAKPDAFVLFYFRREDEGVPAKQEVSIARMDRDYLAVWKKLVHFPIMQGDLAQEITFESAL